MHASTATRLRQPLRAALAGTLVICADKGHDLGRFRRAWTGTRPATAAARFRSSWIELDQLVYAEECGFDTVTIGHHHFMPGNLADLVPATAEQFAYMQWADCSILNVVRPRAGRPALWVCWPATSARGSSD